MQFQAAKLRREFARNSEQQKILLGAPPTSQIEEGVSVHNGGSLRGCHRPPTTLCYLRLSATTPMGLLSVAPWWLGDQGRERPPSTSYRRLYSRSTTYLIAADEDPSIALGMLKSGPYQWSSTS